jgi:hypothetical protein
MQQRKLGNSEARKPKNRMPSQQSHPRFSQLHPQSLLADAATKANGRQDEQDYRMDSFPARQM